MESTNLPESRLARTPRQSVRNALLATALGAALALPSFAPSSLAQVQGGQTQEQNLTQQAQQQSPQALPSGFDLSRAVIISFEADKVRFLQCSKMDGGYYERISPE